MHHMYSISKGFLLFFSTLLWLTPFTSGADKHDNVTGVGVHLTPASAD